jgi:broad specificity phosphatase PhoE
LNEISLGLWQGLLRTEVARRFGNVYRKWQRSPTSVEPPGGEMMDAAYRRIACEIRCILKKHRRGSIAVVCGSVAGALVKCYLKDLDIRGALEMCFEPAKCEIIECR